jgi:UDP-N-acetylglucosamine 2-epimerase (non-hydrolysing)
MRLKNVRNRISCEVCLTAQHRRMLDQVLDVFGISADTDLDLMEENQSLASFASKAISSLDHYLKQAKPDLVIIQGYTTTVFCAALSAFYNRIPMAHVEAGLRSWNINAPWTEEANRMLASRLVSSHFTPMEQSKRNLLKESIDGQHICITRITMIDAFVLGMERNRMKVPKIVGLPCDDLSVFKDRKVVLITGHRRENFGQGFEKICNAIALLADWFPDVAFVYPVAFQPKRSGTRTEDPGVREMAKCASFAAA